MVLSLKELIHHLESARDLTESARASDALWIRFNDDKTHETIEYRTKDGNQIVHVYLDENGGIVGLEIFP